MIPASRFGFEVHDMAALKNLQNEQLLPSTSERTVKIHVCQKFTQVGSCQAELGRKVPGVAVQNLQVAGSSALVSHV